MVDFSRLILNNNDFFLVTCVFMNARLFIDCHDLDCQQRRLKLHKYALYTYTCDLANHKYQKLIKSNEC